ncbi:MAG: PQQ-dependent sugar dehydrogenase [Marinirhabdus sp.]|nr:PQQ-dependent sugar dehydrogenase [Marinirhabdus sp.]
MKYFITLLFICASISSFAQEIELETYATGLSQPVDLKHAGDERLFAVEKNGRIRVIDGTGTVLSTPFLDIVGQTSVGSEQGLLSVAFHPDYADNGKFYINYTIPNGDTRISEYTVSAGDPNVADPASEEIILEFNQTQSNHNGGCLQFGPDGYLYIAAGDGGGAGDIPNNAQNNALLLGTLIRIDVDNPVPGGTNYGIPADNPFAGSTTEREEIWAYGLRNPWKFSFDSATDELWIADVGQNAIEEINRVGSDEAGLNYGWRCYEGDQTFNTSNCPPIEDLTFPVAQYPHSVGFSITGGYVYNGTEYPNLQGYYFFADFGTGVIGTVDGDNNLNNLGTFSGNWSSFGVDQNNELYIVNFSGTVERIVSPQVAGIDENLAGTFTIFPNPASDMITLETTASRLSSYSIVDMKGSMLAYSEVVEASRIDINISNLSNGLYLVKGETADGHTFIKKLVVD